MLTLIDTLPIDMYDDFTFFHRRLLKINATLIFFVQNVLQQRKAFQSIPALCKV
jgi:hypothetical protein